jgi:hypothetical protein
MRLFSIKSVPVAGHLAFFSLVSLLSYDALASHRHRALAAEPSPTPISGLLYEIDHVDDNTVYFKKSETASGDVAVPSPLKLPSLYNIKPLGALRNSNGQPYFLLSAKPCKDCNQDPGIYAIHVPEATEGSVHVAPTGYVFPGRIVDPRSRALLSESRAFYGHCLRSRANDVLVIFQREKIDRHGIQSSVLIADLPHKDGLYHLEETLLERHLPRLNDTVRETHGHACHEIEGKNRLMASRLLDVRALHNRADLDSEDDDENGKGDADDDAEETPAAAGTTAEPAPANVPPNPTNPAKQAPTK